jgi:hypothetical protein
MNKVTTTHAGTLHIVSGAFIVSNFTFCQWGRSPFWHNGCHENGRKVIRGIQV